MDTKAISKQHRLSKRMLFFRLVRSLFFGAIIIILSLFLGMAGYRHYENMSWVDAYVNAAMILSGMGPVSTLTTEAGKFFAGSYAIFSGVIFLVIMGVVFAPVVHHFFTKFHMELQENDKESV